MPITFDTYVFSGRRALLEYSEFELPDGRLVPGLTLEQLRADERRGLYDAFRTSRDSGQVEIVWEPKIWPPGVQRPYTVLDGAVARLSSWMRDDGVPAATIWRVLRGYWGGRAAIVHERAHEVLVFHDGTGVVTLDGCKDREDGRVVMPGIGVLPLPAHRYRLSSLGVTKGSLPRQGKPLKMLHAWNADRPVEDVLQLVAKYAQDHADDREARS